MQTLEELRQEIDQLDAQLLTLLGRRLEVVRQVGKLKKELALPPLQPARWQQVLEKNISLGEQQRLGKQFVSDIWNRIHDEALRIEAAIQNQKTPHE
jgi:chorismate mutase